MTVAESGRHPGVIGAAVVILIHGFESLSQQMVILEQRPRETPSNSWNPNTPAPARSEVWDTYLLRGFTGGKYLGASIGDRERWLSRGRPRPSAIHKGGGIQRYHGDRDSHDHGYV
jgi:hypothetical protein